MPIRPPPLPRAPAAPRLAVLTLPPARRAPGTYPGVVGPALKGKGPGGTFGDLIGRATFIYEG